MANTPNLNLEEISLNDTIKTDFINKINSNQTKIDTKYGYLVDNLLENTRKDTLVEAVEEVNNLAGTILNLEGQVENLTNDLTILRSKGNAPANKIVSGYKAVVLGEEINGTGFNELTTATTSDILQGKTAYSNDGTLITGNAEKKKTVNVSLEGSYSGTSYITMAGAALNGDTLVIYAQGASTATEHIYFTTSSIIGTKGSGWDTYPAGTGDPITVVYACTITGLNNYNTINVTLNANSRNTSYDYIGISVTVTGS